MKKILFAALAAAFLATSCQKTEIINQVGDAIDFNAALNKLTKASDAAAQGLVNLQEQDFRVWAYANYEDANTQATELDAIYDGIANMNVHYTAGTDGAAGTWAPAKKYYWPGTDKGLRFFAVSGVSLGDDLSNADDKIAIAIKRAGEGEAQTVAPTLTVKDFVVDHASPNADLMVADFVCQDQSKKEVDLVFRHALSKVEFLFKTLEGSDDVVFVQSVSVENVNTKANLVVSENVAGSEKPMLFTWDAATTPQTFVDDYNTTDASFPADIELLDKTEGATADKTAMKLTTDATVFTTWLVMPQTISTLQAKVRFVMGTREFERIFPLSKDALTAWTANQYVKYTITLAPNYITFNPTVGEWDPMNGQNVEMGN